MIEVKCGNAFRDASEWYLSFKKTAGLIPLHDYYDIFGKYLHCKILLSADCHPISMQFEREEDMTMFLLKWG